jgi:hypothetical protein
MEKNKAEEMQNTPDLDRIMQDGRAVFAGAAEPESDATGPVIVGHPGETPGTPEADPAENPAAAAKPAEVPPAAPQPAVAPPEPDGKGKEPPRGDYRFKTLEDADKSYRLLQAEKTKAEQRLKALEAERESIRTEQRRREAAATEDRKFLEFATERNKQALAEINDLNPDDPAYTDKAAECWARANLEIRRFSAAPGQNTPGEGFAAPAPAAAPGSPTAPAEETSPSGFLTTRTFVESVLEGANLGIPKDDPLFWAFAEQSPAVNEDGTPIPMKDQIWWAVDRTLNYRRESANPAAPASPATPPAAQATGSPPAPPAGPGAAQPMGRSGAFRPAGGGSAPAGPVSLAETLDSVMEMRRL